MSAKLAFEVMAFSPAPVREFRFHPVRKFRFDYAWPDRKVAVEIEGGVFTAGRHTRGPGYLRDMEKYNLAVELGWRVLRYSPSEVNIPQIMEVLNASV